MKNVGRDRGKALGVAKGDDEKSRCLRKTLHEENIGGGA